jgi:hypothetical protein
MTMAIPVTTVISIGMPVIVIMGAMRISIIAITIVIAITVSTNCDTA